MLVTGNNCSFISAQESSLPDAVVGEKSLAWRAKLVKPFL